MTNAVDDLHAYESSNLQRLFPGLAGPLSVGKAHPTFSGVFLSECASATETRGAFRTLVVRLEPGARMLPHQHATQLEQHFVLSGDGTVVQDGESRRYQPGSLRVIPKGQEHSVQAGKHGMLLLAIFSPAEG